MVKNNLFVPGVLEKPDTVETLSPISPANSNDSWGWFPVLSVVAALGLLLIAVINTVARTGESWVRPWFWVGLLLVFVPVAVRLVLNEVARRERLALVALLSIDLYLIKVLHSPLYFTFYDEILHWRTAYNILSSGHLFNENSLLPVSPLYPGLENATTSVVSLSGLPIFQSGVIVLGVARLMFSLALFLFYEKASHSSRVASVAVLFYMGNLNFLFFTAQYGYESLSLPFSAFALWALTLRSNVPAHSRVGVSLAALLGIVSVITTHHLTSYALIAFLSLWVIVTFGWRRAGTFLRPALHHALDWLIGKINIKQLGKGWLEQFGKLRHRRMALEQSGSVPAALLAIAAMVFWIINVAGMTTGYLLPQIVDGVNQLMRVVSGESSGRQFFNDFGGERPPFWEQLISYSSVLLIMGGLLLGLLQIWRRHYTSALAMTLGVAALGYPLSQSLRLTQKGLELAGRSSEFLFLALGFTLAVGICEIRWKKSVLQTTLLTTIITVIFMSGVILGWLYWMRVPGSYLAAADTRSVEPQSMEAAYWAGTYLKPGGRLGGDRINGTLMGAYGKQYLVTASYDKVFMPAVFLTPYLSQEEEGTLAYGKLRYLVVDYRLSQGLPMVGFYYETGEPNTMQHRTPIGLNTLTKFEFLRNTSRFFDSGSIVMYDVGALTGEH